MSEYQFVHFLALDRPLDDKQLAYMERQSTRAEITQWEFTNEYHFGDFHGNAREMLRHGYDVHLHYANFGRRRLMMRLPTGLPCDRRTFQVFRVDRALEWIADKKGNGGILAIEPEGDAGAYDEGLYEVGAMLPKIAPVRGELIGGDLRALYLLWLVCNFDGESLEPPVPAGLGKLTPALKTLAKFYELSGDLIAAAAKNSPPTPKSADASETLKKWIARQPAGTLRELVGQLLADAAAAARADILSRIRDEVGTTAWPTAEPSRTLGELREMADGLRDRRVHRGEQARGTARRKRLATMHADPSKVIAHVEELVKQRSEASYEQAARELADLREALGPELGPARVRAVAKNLRSKNPRLNRLIGSLRKHGLLDG